MRVSITNVVATLASVTMVVSTAIPNAGSSDVIISAGSNVVARSEVADVGLVSTGAEVYNDDDFVGTPKEIYIKVNARLGSLGLGLEKRNMVYQPLCTPVGHWNWKAANVYNADKCRNQMGSAGRFTVGGHSCARVCCIAGDQVWICNDNAGSIDPALPYIQSYVGDIANHCSFNTIAGQLAGGQMFDTDHYNVILRGNQGVLQDCAFSP